MRLYPHTLTFGDIHRHPRLKRRAAVLECVLARHCLNDFFAVPSIEAHRPATMAVIS
jgi:hypothetical protein